MVADFWAAIAEAERNHFLGVLGLHELLGALEREEQRLDVSHDEDIPADVARSLQAAWERAEMARVEIANGHPHLNAEALLSMNSALDALVDEWVPAMRAIRVRWLADQWFGLAESKAPQVARKLTSEQQEAIREALRGTLTEKLLTDLEPLRGSGLGRYEPRLAQEGLGEPADRPIPEDLSEALAELGAIRDVLVHRAGRIDEKGLQQAPSLDYEDGELVRLTPEDYRRYSAAINCYAAEILFRSVRDWPEASDEEDGPNLAKWRGYYRIVA
jgi:hypothetical protein